MHLKPSLRLFRTLAIIIPAIILWGCVGEGDGPQRIAGTPAPALTGVLIDAPVSGASFQGSGGLSGLTNDMGEFQYRPFDLVTFSVGGIVLGTAQGAPFITVVELTNSIDPTSPAATNMLVFLQSIDSDGDPTNGITISASTRTAAAGRSLDFFAADFDTQVAAVVAAIAPGNSVIGASDALFNFYQAYADLGGTDTFDFGFPGFPPVGGGQTFELIFADEFNGDSLSAANWNIETGYGPDNNGWGNNEWQLYTDSADNLRVEDGNLVISAQCPTPPCGVRDGTVTSARINSLDKVEFRYGKIIARIKPPVGAGTWPAFWSMGANFPEIGWPRSGEIDFMEMFAGVSDSRTTHSTIHWCDENFATPLPALCFPEANGKRAFTQSRTFAESLGDDFHIWETDWTPGRITVSMDGVQYFDASIDPATQEEFLRDFFLIFNVAMGGTAGSNEQPPNGTEVFPQTMLVDYVRVYQQVGDGPAADVLVDFEDAPDSYNFGPDGGFAGGASSVIANPDPTGINTTAQVAQMQKFFVPPPDTFGGSTLQLGSNLNFAQGEVFKMKVWATRPVPVLFKLEDAITGMPADGLESFVDHTGSGMWEELCFDFTGDTANFTSNSITFIFDINNSGDAENNPNDWTFYFDEIEQTDSCDDGGGGEPPPPLISSFSNGSFETGDLADWVSDGNNTVGAPGVGAFAGTLAAQLTTTGGTGVALLSQTFSANPGDEINFSAYMLTETALPPGDTFGLAKIVFKDAGGNGLVPESASIGTLQSGDNPGIDSVPLLNSDSTPNTWIFTEAQGVAPAGTTQVEILLLNVDFAGGENPMWFDFAELSLVTDEPPPPPGLALSNGGFETGDLTDWTGNGTNTVGAPGAGAFEGAAAAQLTTTGGAGVAEISQTFAAAEGDEFNFSVYMLTEAALPSGPTFGLGKIVFQDAGGNDLVPASASIGVLNTDNPGIDSAPTLNDGSAVNTWVFTEAQGVAPAGTTQVKFILLNVDFAGGENPMWFDGAVASLVEGDGGVGEACSPCTIDFETPGFGGGFDWSVFENADNPPLEIVANPDMTGNTSATVAKFTARVGGEFFAGVQTFHPGVNNDPGVADIGPFTFDSTNSVVKVWVWKPVISEVRMQFVNTTDGAQEPLSATNTLVNQWEQLTFDFTSFIGTTGFVDTDRLVIFPDWNQAGRTSDNIIYFDEITFGGLEEPPPPPPGIALSNGGFETGDLTDWTGSGTNTVGAPGAGAFEGAAAAQLTTTGGAGVAEISQTFAASEGDEVNFSAYMLTEAALPSGPTFGLAKIVFQDAGGNDLVPASASIGTLNTDNPGIDSAPLLDAASPINTWVFTEAQGVAPAGTTQVKFLLLNVDFAGGENPMWFDAVEASLVDGEPPPPPPPGIALSNGGFETGDLTDWTGSGTNTVGAPGAGAFEGAAAAQLTTTGGAGVAEISQTFAASEGDEVNFSAYMLTEAALPSGPTFGLAKIVFQDAGGNDLVPASASIGTLNTDNPGIDSAPLLDAASPINTWVFTEAQGVAPAGTTQVKFLLLNVDFAGGENPMWFDAVEASLVDGEPPPPPPPGIALSNGGFETGDLTDWTGSGTNTVGAPGAGAFEGAAAAQLTTTGGAGVAEISQTFAASEGDEVNFSAYMLTEAALPSGPTFGLAKIVFQDAGGNDLVPASASIGTLNTDNPGIDSAPLLDAASPINTWVFTEAQGVAPAGTTQVKFLLLNVDFAGGENPMWFDSAAASLVEGEPPPPPPPGIALSNGGFETGDLTDWTGSGTNTVGAPGAGAFEGAAAAQLTTTGGAGVAEISQTFDAIPGDEVNFSAYMLTEAALPSGPTFGLAKIVFRDAGGNDLVPASASIGTLNTDNPGIDSAPLLDAASPINTWVFTEAQGVAPAGTVQVVFLLLNVDFAGGENPMWFDAAEASLVTAGVPPPPPPPALALSNGGFETGDLTDWTGSGTNTVSAPGVGAQEGSFAAQLTTTGGAGVAEIRQTFDAAPGDEVNFSVYMLTEAALPTGDTFGLGKIIFQDADGNDLVPESASIGVLNTDNPGVDSAPTLNDTSPVNTWVFTEAQGVAPAGTTQVAFLLLNVDFAGGENPMWFDGAQASIVDACGGDVGGELTTNGDFEGSPGTLDCWDIFPGGGTITADSTENNTIGGMWSAHAVAGPGNNPVLKQSFLAPGVVQPGDTILISFDMKGSAVAGGIVFPELIDERSDMGATGQLLDTIVAPTPGWTTYFYSPMAGPDVAGGITFQIAVVCGGDPACSNNVFIDNVSVQISGGG